MASISKTNISKLGFSIGKVNYCLKALIDIGFIKIHNFNNSNNKLNYAYILTPKGIQEKTAITKQFIIKKKQEYDKLNSYIDNNFLCKKHIAINIPTILMMK